MLKDLIEGNEDSHEDIPLANIPSIYLKDILEYCEHFNFTKEINIPKPLPSNNLA